MRFIDLYYSSRTINSRRKESCRSTQWKRKENSFDTMTSCMYLQSKINAYRTIFHSTEVSTPLESLTITRQQQKYKYVNTTQESIMMTFFNEILLRYQDCILSLFFQSSSLYLKVWIRSYKSPGTLHLVVCKYKSKYPGIL